MIQKREITTRKDSHPFRYFVPVLCIIIAGAVMLHGCKDLSPTAEKDRVPDPQIELESLKSHAESAEEFIRQANRHFIHLAERVPGFGGIFLEDKGTRLVIRTTNVNTIDRASIENDVKVYLNTEAPIVGSAVEGGVPAMELRFKEANYEYNQLREWQDLIMEPMLDSEGVTLISLSQRQNKIRVGIEEERFENGISELAYVNEIPENAIEISVTGAIQDLRSNHSLRDIQRPLAGGLENNLYDSNGVRLRGACTYSFNAWWSPEGIMTRHWLTNSHCTRMRWSVFSNDQYYQSSITDGSAGYIGYEVHDPPGFNLPFFGCSSTPCRFSDSALIKLSGNQNTWDFGTIARTEGFGALPGEGSGSLVINHSDPRFEIVSEAESSDYFEGLWISKVGRSTGWTIGEVTDTCVHLNHFDSNIGNFRYLCQEMGTLFVQPGDSASPVFAPSGPPQVTLYGIVWAMLGQGQGSVFSRITGVKEDLGHMITH